MRLFVSYFLIMSPRTAIDAANQAALARWHSPFPGFTSGRDPRTTDNALLGLMYGGLAHAAHHDWLHAGHRLIDETYIKMLWHVQGLTKMQTPRAEQISAELDNFIIDSVKPIWDSLEDLGKDERLHTATSLVKRMAGQCFGSAHSESAASRLSFFLFPMLPVFNFSRGHLLALSRIKGKPTTDDYGSYAGVAYDTYREICALLQQLPTPTPAAGNGHVQELIGELLDESDWWCRRVFDEYLRLSLQLPDSQLDPLFECDAEGNLAAGTLL